MTAPVIQSIQHTGTTLYIIWDRAVTASDLSGFTFTEDGTPISPSFGSVSENAVIATLGGAITGALLVSYSGAGTVAEAVAPTDPAAAFTDQVGVAYYAAPTVRRAQAGLTANDTVTIFFGEPVGSPTADLVTGLTIEVDDVALDLSSATASLSADQTQLTIDTGVNFAYNAAVDVIYDDSAGDLYSWPTGAVSSFTLNAIQNVSTDGLPNSSYPLSYVIREALTVANNVVTATVSIVLNPIDIELAARYGPVTVYTGGTYGTTPYEISVVGSTTSVVDGKQISQAFSDASMAADKVALAAAEWLTTVATRIGIALGAVRTADQATVLGDRTVQQV